MRKSQWSLRRENTGSRKGAFVSIGENTITSSTMKEIISILGDGEAPVGEHFGGDLVRNDERMIETLGEKGDTIPVIRAWAHGHRRGRESSIIWPVGTDAPKRTAEKFWTLKQDRIMVLYDDEAKTMLSKEPDDEFAYRYDKDDNDRMYADMKAFLTDGTFPKAHRVDARYLMSEDREWAKAHKYVVMNGIVSLYRKMRVANSSPATIEGKKRPTFVVRVNKGKTGEIASTHSVRAKKSGSTIHLKVGNKNMTVKWNRKSDRMEQILVKEERTP